MDTTLQLAAAIVAVIASGVGVIVALDQLTLRARLRKTEAWARESATGETDKHRERALEDLRLRSVAGVVASHAVPPRFFAVCLLTPVTAVAMLVAAFQRGEAVFPDLTTLLFVSLVGCGVEFRRMIRFYLERRLVVNIYIAGGRMVPGPRLDLMDTLEGGVRTEFLAALGVSAGLNVALLGAAMLRHDSEATFGPTLLLLGPSLAWWALTWVRTRGRVVGAERAPSQGKSPS